MGRQWLHAKRAVASMKKAQATGKLVREIMVAARTGGPDPELNARLAAAVEKARKESVSREVIERATKKGAGIGEDKLALEHVLFEGYAPHKVPVIVGVYTDNVNRTAPEIRLLFRQGQLGTAGSNRFLFDHTGIVEAHHPDPNSDLEAAGIEAGANEVEPLRRDQNDDIPELLSLARTVSRWENEIVAAVLTGITNAVSESLNRLAKLEARLAYGFRNPVNQRRRVRIACTRGHTAALTQRHRRKTRLVTRRQHDPG